MVISNSTNKYSQNKLKEWMHGPHHAETRNMKYNENEKQTVNNVNHKQDVIHKIKGRHGTKVNMNYFHSEIFNLYL